MKIIHKPVRSAYSPNNFNITYMPKRYFLFSILTLFISIPVQSQLLTDWQFAQREFGGIWEVWRNVSYEKDIWSEVKVPHCFNAEDAVDPHVKYYQGEGWYKTGLSIQNPYPNGRTLLHFEGVGQKASVYVYQTKVEEHIGGYDEFAIDITEAVAAYQENKQAFTRKAYGKLVPLAICADNSRNLNRLPSDLSDFNLYGGMYRHVELMFVPQISLQHLHISSELDEKKKKAKLTIKPYLYNPENLVASLTLNVCIKDPQGKILHQTQLKSQLSKAVECSFTLDKPALWSPDAPNLYTCEVELISPVGKQTMKESFGIRSFHFEKKGPFYLNGERLLLKGTHRHEDHAGQGAVISEADLLKEFLLMKEMGVNFIRLGHYQQSRRVLELCDSLGILVWEEIPWCRAGADSEGQKQDSEAALRSLIAQHYNHPSIIIWGLGNEHDWRGEREKLDTMAIRDHMTYLHELAHFLDDSRKTAIRRCNFAKDIVDVYSPSIWAGWYRGKFTEYEEVSRKEMEEVDHFLHVEWGASHFSYRHSEDPDKGIEAVGKVGSADEREGDFLLLGGDARVSRDGDWSTTYACNLIDWHLKEQEHMPWLTGTAYWPFKDFSTPLRPENPIPYVNQKGVLERDFAKKESFYVFQSYWTEKPMIHIYGSSWPIRWGKEGEEKLIKIYANCEEVELILDGESMGKKKRNSQDFPAAGLRWRVPLTSGSHTVVAIGTKGKEVVRDRLSFTYQTEPWGKPTQFVFEKTQEMGDSVLVEARLLDAKGIPCLDARDFVLFGLAGAGKLLDNQGTSIGSRRIALANGRARIWVKKNQGNSIVSVNMVPDVGKEFPRVDVEGAFLELK